MKFKGKVWKFGPNINTDEIIPAKFLNVSDGKELAKHCMSGIDEKFISKIQAGDIIVGGDNFGCGSSREHAPLAIKESGISCVIASSFARIFFRNSINIGFPIIECKDAKRMAEGDILDVDFDDGIILNISKKESYKISQFPMFMQSIINCGGLMNRIKKDKKR